MAYFPNGTSFEFYAEQFCNRCINSQDGGCPITDLHMRWNYEAIKDATKREALDSFIKGSPDGTYEKCRMFKDSQ